MISLTRKVSRVPIHTQSDKFKAAVRDLILAHIYQLFSALNKAAMGNFLLQARMQAISKNCCYIILANEFEKAYIEAIKKKDHKLIFSYSQSAIASTYLCSSLHKVTLYFSTMQREDDWVVIVWLTKIFKPGMHCQLLWLWKRKLEHGKQYIVALESESWYFIVVSIKELRFP